MKPYRRSKISATIPGGSDNLFGGQNPKSKIRSADQTCSLLDEAHRYLVGGVNSPVRDFKHVGAKPLIVLSATNSEVISSEGRHFVDFIMGWGALILGHKD